MSINVKIVQLGKGVTNCEFGSPPTVAEVLEAQGIPMDGMDVRVNAESTPMERPLAEGDLVTIVPRIKGGNLAGNRGWRAREVVTLSPSDSGLAWR